MREGKYAPLAERLGGVRSRAVELSFIELERLLGELPVSAKRHAAWWANDASHVQAKAWLGTGWIVTKVDRKAEHVRFERGPISPRPTREYRHTLATRV